MREGAGRAAGRAVMRSGPFCRGRGRGGGTLPRRRDRRGAVAGGGGRCWQAGPGGQRLKERGRARQRLGVMLGRPKMEREEGGKGEGERAAGELGLAGQARTAGKEWPAG